MAYTLEDIKKKKKDYDDAIKNKPGSFSSDYQSLRDGVLEKIANRSDFSYDPFSDEVYNLYRDRYISEGKKAMKDTMSAAATLTGGYANSYAVRAGADAYNDYLSRSTDIIPDLYDLAFDRYKTAASYEDDLYSYYSDLYDSDYDAYEGLWDRYYKDVSQSESAYKTAKDSYDYDEKVKWDKEEAARKASLEAEKLRQKAEEAATKAEIEREKLRQSKEAAKNGSSNKTSSSSSNKTSSSSSNKTSSSSSNKTSSSSSNKTSSSSSNKTSSSSSNKTSSSSSNKTSSSSSSSNTATTVKRETEAIKSFRSSLLSKTKFNSSPVGRVYSSYNDYVRMSAQSWYKEGRLTEGELNYIKDMYVLR